MVVVEKQMKKLSPWPPTSSSSIAQVELVDLVVKEMVYAVGQVVFSPVDHLVPIQQEYHVFRKEKLKDANI